MNAPRRRPRTPNPPTAAAALPLPPVGRYAALLRRNVIGRHRRLLITGMRGSGATAVASLLQQAGFFLGSDLEPLTLESASLQPLLAAGALDRAQAMLAAWAAHVPHVACKSAALFTEACVPLVRALPSDWLVLAVCRDPAALAQRSLMSGGTDLAQALIGFARQQDELVRFATSINKSVLFVSYERLMLSPETAFAEILTHVEPGAEPLPPFDVIWTTLLSQRKRYRGGQVATPEISAGACPP